MFEACKADLYRLPQYHVNIHVVKLHEFNLSLLIFRGIIFLFIFFSSFFYVSSFVHSTPYNAVVWMVVIIRVKQKPERQSLCSVECSLHVQCLTYTDYCCMCRLLSEIAAEREKAHSSATQKKKLIELLLWKIPRIH